MIQFFEFFEKATNSRVGRHCAECLESRASTISERWYVFISCCILTVRICACRGTSTIYTICDTKTLQMQLSWIRISMARSFIGRCRLANESLESITANYCESESSRNNYTVLNSMSLQEETEEND